MKILHVIASLDPADGGPPAIASRLAAAQARLGHEVAVLAYARPEGAAVLKHALIAIPDIGRCRLELVPTDGWREHIFAASARGRCEHLLRDADVAHLHGVWDHLLLVAARTARRHGRRYVVLANGMLEPWSLEQRKWKKKLAMALGYRRMLDEALFVHTGNADERALLAPLRLRCPVEVFPNGVFPEEIDPLPARGSFRRSYPELSDKPFVLFLSRLHYKKGLGYLADAFKVVACTHRDVKLVVAGPDAGVRADFESRIAAAGLTERVLLVGPLFGQQKLQAMVDATVFCLPSRAEGFSVALLEALACGLPVVISRQCHFPEVASAGAGEVVELNAAAIADGILRILDNDDLRMRMSAAARELVLSRYTWPAIARDVVRAYAAHAHIDP